MTNKELERKIEILEKTIKRLCNFQVKENKKWVELTWDEIRETIDNGTNTVLDTDGWKQMELYTGEVVDVACVKNQEGEMRFMFKVDGCYEMNETDTNEGGFETSKMAKVYIPRFEKLLPEKFSLTLPSEYEFLRNELMMKYIKDKENEVCNWYWTSTPYPSITNGFSLVDSIGSGLYNNAGSTYGVAFCFTLKSNTARCGGCDD